MGRTNDAIIYGGSVQLFVTGPDGDAEKLAKDLPSAGSRDYGRPFAEIFNSYNGDFYAMTGELVDLFADRAEGVGRLSQTMAEHFADDELRVYAGRQGFVASPGEHWRAVASANWHASARFVGTHCAQALFIDVGSTTADIVPIRNGQVDAAGYTDDERLVSEELVYTGVTRTPIMARLSVKKCPDPVSAQASRGVRIFFAIAERLPSLPSSPRSASARC